MTFFSFWLMALVLFFTSAPFVEPQTGSSSVAESFPTLLDRLTASLPDGMNGSQLTNQLTVCSKAKSFHSQLKVKENVCINTYFDAALHMVNYFVSVSPHR